MAGLSAAAALQKAGRNAVVIDKGRGVGGRNGKKDTVFVSP
jgi:predicted NAD/FAD-dependent oxidoreductase